MHKFPSKTTIIIFFVMCVFLFSACNTTQRYYVNTTYDTAKKFYNLKDYSNSIINYKKYIEENPDNAMTEIAMYYLACSYKESNDKQNAISAYNDVITKYKEGFWVEMAKKDLEELK